MRKEQLTSPYDLVANALDCDKQSLNEESCMLNHPKWDSLSHVSIIVAIETNYNMQIPDEEVMKYDNMKAIINLYNDLVSGQ